jgi:signal recognition particle receptor subunit beta
MSVIDPRKREVQLKLVYYGMGLSGKTTNLAYLHRNVIGEEKSEFLTIATEGERTLFFDFLPVELGLVRGYKLRLKTYTVPGQNMYAITRSTVLNGADGVIFVVDSAEPKLKENKESYAELRQNLERQRRKWASVPVVVQYNKRDAPDALPVEFLDNEINERHDPAFAAIATRGPGVFESFREIMRLVVKIL